MVERVFNGISGRANEAGLWFDFCKTARKPYDLPVCACLIVLQHYFGDQFRVSSDGGIDTQSWPSARELCLKLFGYGDDFQFAD
jgi:hypothetical protein